MLTWRLGMDKGTGRFYVDMPELGLRLGGAASEADAMVLLTAWVRLYVSTEAHA